MVTGLMEEAEAFLALHFLMGEDRNLLSRALDSHSSAKQAYRAMVASAPCLERPWEKEWHDLVEQRVELLWEQHPKFPSRLRDLKVPPVLLYAQGDLDLFEGPSIAVVGTRHPSLYGVDTAFEFGRACAVRGLTVVSGGARGIDTAAHRGCLEAHGKTVGIMGSGLLCPYPRENITLFAQISQQGLLLSEYRLRASPRPHHFPKRNRLINALADATFLVEAPLKSGAMLTAEMALQSGKPLFVLPGRIDLETFRGNHALLKSGNAILVDSFEAIFEHPRFAALHRSAQPLGHRASLEQGSLLNRLPNEEFSCDLAAQALQLPVHEVVVLLMDLVDCQLIREYPGRVFKKTASAVV